MGTKKSKIKFRSTREEVVEPRESSGPTKTSTGKKGKRPTALLAAVQLHDMSEDDLHASLAELGRLVDTLGYEVIGQVTQRRAKPVAAAMMGEGKIKELAAWTGGSGLTRRHEEHLERQEEKAKRNAKIRGEDWEEEEEEEEEEADEQLESDSDTDDAEDGDDADSTFTKPTRKADVVIFDNELTAGQVGNLDNATGVPVMDRSGVIIEIFSRHARTKEARLQVEIARLKYIAPRLRESRIGADRQGGGGGVSGRGAGESAAELDRRRVRLRLAELQRQLKEVSAEQSTRRERRVELNRVALVGYTNAGKSSLMRALTGNEVLVADKLFATLDTTVRNLKPPTDPKILITDTVGFIKKLPHDLVASFRSTLDEALDASLLLFVVDASDTSFREQLAVTHEVLGEIGARERPSLLVLNKWDRVPADARRGLMREFPDAVALSALNKADVGKLRDRLMEHFNAKPVGYHAYDAAEE